MKPACFLDRDGVIVEEVEYLADPEAMRLIDGAGAAIRRLNDAGVPVIVVTNQAGVARGYFPESRLEALHARLREELAVHGAMLDAIYYCPHHPTAGQGDYRVACACRKPKPGMLLQAARDHDLDLRRSFLIGDKPSDLGAGRDAGCRTILVRTGYGAGYDDEALARSGHPPDHVAADLAAAVAWCLPRLTRAGDA